MKTAYLALALAAILAAACASPPSPVPVMAEPGDLAQLAGTWSGYYDSPAVERRGTIMFELEAGRDTARGDVTMIPRGWTRPLGPAENPAEVARKAPIPELLTIKFVRVREGLISGTMEPYRDPDCGCEVYTTFEGVLKDDAIEGTFVARPGTGPPYRGTWLVTRRDEEKSP